MLVRLIVGFLKLLPHLGQILLLSNCGRNESKMHAYNSQAFSNDKEKREQCKELLWPTADWSTCSSEAGGSKKKEGVKEFPVSYPPNHQLDEEQ